jgi:hypothetical protein
LSVIEVGTTENALDAVVIFVALLETSIALWPVYTYSRPWIKQTLFFK